MATYGKIQDDDANRIYTSRGRSASQKVKFRTDDVQDSNCMVTAFDSYKFYGELTEEINCTPRRF